MSAYSIYIEQKCNEIKTKLIFSVAKLIDKYVKYLNSKIENRLLDILHFNKNLIYYQIK